MPVYVFTATYYMDSSSFGLGVIALALLLKGFSTDKHTSVFWVILASFVKVIGITEKMTAIIPVLAGGCTAILFQKKLPVKKGVAYCIGVFCAMLLVNIWAGQYPIDRESREQSNPIFTWIAMGMHGDGSYSDNVVYAEKLTQLTTRDEKSAYAKQYAKEHFSEAFTWSHILAKIKRSFGSGTFECANFLTRAADGHGLLWEMLHPWGKYYWRTSQYCFIYIAMIYGIVLIGSICTLVRLLQGSAVSAIKFAADLSFMGIFLFLLLWESSNRQLYNQFPMLLISLVESTALIMSRRRGR